MKREVRHIVDGHIFCLRHGRGVALLLLLIPLFTCSFVMLSEQDDEEYSIKAAFIYKFTNYIDWGTAPQGNEFVIGIAGSSPVMEQLTEIARTKTVKDKKIVIHQFDKLDDITPCQILFISKRSALHPGDVLARVAGKGTLIISEKSGYAKKGSGINFIEVDNNLKFEANPREINAAGLKASSQLLKLAIIVN